MQRILVAGGVGFIGSHLCKHLLQKDYEISPQSEDYFGNVNPVGVRSVYDASKK